MAVPKRRKSKARRDTRRSQNTKITAPAKSLCPQCRRPKQPHRVCIHCGFYKGREIVTFKSTSSHG